MRLQIPKHFPLHFVFIILGYHHNHCDHCAPTFRLPTFILYLLEIQIVTCKLQFLPYTLFAFAHFYNSIYFGNKFHIICSTALFCVFSLVICIFHLILFLPSILIKRKPELFYYIFAYRPSVLILNIG